MFHHFTSWIWLFYRPTIIRLIISRSHHMRIATHRIPDNWCTGTVRNDRELLNWIIRSSNSLHHHFELTSFNPRQNLSNTPLILPPFSMDITRLWSSSLIQTKKFLSALCLHKKRVKLYWSVINCDDRWEIVQINVYLKSKIELKVYPVY